MLPKTKVEAAGKAAGFRAKSSPMIAWLAGRPGGQAAYGKGRMGR